MSQQQEQAPGQEPAAAANPAGTPAEPAAPEGGAPAAAGDGAGDAVDKFAGLPEDMSWLRKGYEDRGTEAQQLRARLRETEEQLAGAKTPEEFAQLQADATKRQAELERELAVNSAAREHGLSDDSLALLEGVPADKIAERAALLAKIAGGAKPAAPVVTKVPMRGGSTPGGDAQEPDGASLWRKYRDSQ